jgi:hypothetical protein
LVVSVWESLQLPVAVVAGHVVVSAEGAEVVVVGGPALCVGSAVVEVTVVGVLAASDHHTIWIVTPNTALLGFGEPGGERPGGDWPSVVFSGGPVSMP